MAPLRVQPLRSRPARPQHQPVGPAHTSAAPSWSPASPASADVPTARRATARCSPGSPGYRPASPHCAAAPAIPSMPSVPGAVRPPARPTPCARHNAISSRSAKERYRPESGLDDRARCDGAIPPASRNHRAPTGGETPTSIAASSLDRPSAMNAQNRRRCACRATGGRPGDLSLLRKARSERRRPAIATTLLRVCCDDHMSPPSMRTT